MRSWHLLLSGFILLSCSSDEEEVTGSIMEYQFEDELLMDGQPEIVQDFFRIDTSLIGDDFCYDKKAVQELVIGDKDSIDGDGLNGWEVFSVNATASYLLFENTECFVTLEFKELHQEGNKVGLLNQVNKSDQQLDYLVYDEDDSRWNKERVLPRPKLENYFDGLTDAERKLVNEYGYQYYYLKPNSDTISCLFSDWKMGMALEGTDNEFDREAEYRFNLYPTDKGFELERVKIDISIKN